MRLSIEKQEGGSKDSGPEIKVRQRGAQKDSKKGGIDLGSMLGELKLNIGLDAEDKSALKEAINTMTDKMEHRWIITQRLMIVAIGLAVLGQLINWGLGV
jgi:hypothetical protein